MCICCFRQAKARYEGELKLRSMNNDHVGAMEWDWVWSMLQAKDGKLTANAELLERAQQQVGCRAVALCPGQLNG